MYRHPVSRRTLLRGLGASLLLPFLPSLAFADDPKSATETPPRRFALLLFANGVWEEHWWQKAGPDGRVTELSSTLQPLRPHLEQCLFLNGLHLFDDTVGVHTPFFTNFLSGEPIKPGTVPNLAESLDQHLARAVGGAVAVPAIALGIEPAGFGLSGGSPSIYSGTVSWSTPTTPVVPEILPRRAFDRLFDVSGLIRDRSVLDHVAAQAKALQPTLDHVDRQRMDEYLTTIRELERRIDVATAPERAGWKPSLREPDLARPDDGVPKDTRAHMQLMLDILLLALRMDKTRVATLLFQKDVTGMRFNFLEGVSNSGMHDISHHRKRPEVLEEYRRINRFHVELLAGLVDRMGQVDEGGGTTLLDNTMLLFGSTMGDGDTHHANQLPLVLCGGRSAGIRGGRALTYTKLEERRLCNLHLDLLHRMGATAPSFGNSVMRLPGMGS